MRNNHGELVAGFVLIAIGAVLLLDRLDILSFSEVFKYWPVLLIGAGIAQLAEVLHDRERTAKR